MPRGYRGIILALFGWLILAGASPPTDQNRQTQTGNQQAPSKPEPLALKYAPYSGYDPDPCYKHPDHESADLCAQWRAAIAAEKTTGLTIWANWIAGGSAIFSFISIVLVWLALRQSDASLGLTRDALEHARNVARAELRPWLTFTGFKSEEFSDGIGEGGRVYPGTGVQIQIMFTNSGKTPAVRAAVYNEMRVEPVSAPRPTFQAAMAAGWESTVGPGMLGTGTRLIVMPEDYDAMRNHTSVCWVYMYIEYYEPGDYKSKYTTENCLQISYAGIAVDPSGVETPRFSAIPEGAQNNLT